MGSVVLSGTGASTFPHDAQPDQDKTRPSCECARRCTAHRAPRLATFFTERGLGVCGDSAAVFGERLQYPDGFAWACSAGPHDFHCHGIGRRPNPAPSDSFRHLFAASARACGSRGACGDGAGSRHFTGGGFALGSTTGCVGNGARTAVCTHAGRRSGEHCPALCVEPWKGYGFSLRAGAFCRSIRGGRPSPLAPYIFGRCRAGGAAGKGVGLHPPTQQRGDSPGRRLPWARACAHRGGRCDARVLPCRVSREKLRLAEHGRAGHLRKVTADSGHRLRENRGLQRLRCAGHPSRPSALLDARA